MLEGGGIPERRPKIRRDKLVKSPSHLCCKTTVASMIRKNHLAQVLWDFVKKIRTIKPIRWYLDTIHTLVVRVWRIGLRAICGTSACFGKHNSRPHPTSHRYPKVKLSGKGPTQFSPAFHQWVWTIRNRVPRPFNMMRCWHPQVNQWLRATSTFNWGLNFESRTFLRSWGSSALSYHPWPWGVSFCFEVLAIWWIGATTTRPCFVFSLFDLWVSSLTALLLCVSICIFI